MKRTITAMLIIPAAAARPLAKTPEGMAGLAVAIGVLSVVIGLNNRVELSAFSERVWRVEKL